MLPLWSSCQAANALVLEVRRKRRRRGRECIRAVLFLLIGLCQTKHLWMYNKIEYHNQNSDVVFFPRGCERRLPCHETEARQLSCLSVHAGLSSVYGTVWHQFIFLLLLMDLICYLFRLKLYQSSHLKTVSSTRGFTLADALLRCSWDKRLRCTDRGCCASFWTIHGGCWAPPWIISYRWWTFFSELWFYVLNLSISRNPR